MCPKKIEPGLEINVLLKEYEIVQKSQQDANFRLFQTWIGFGAILTGVAAIIVTNRSDLMLLAPLGLLFWLFVIGIVSYDIQYRAEFLSSLEERINDLCGKTILSYESFASTQMWKFRIRTGMPISLILVTIAYLSALAAYIGLCLFAVQSITSLDIKNKYMAIYLLPLGILVYMSLIKAPQQMRNFRQSLLSGQAIEK